MNRSAVALLLCLAILSPPALGADTVTFEPFDDDTPLSGQIGGLHFQNAVVLKAQFSLNEIDFPPHSGTNAAVNEGGDLALALLAPAQAVSGFVTYAQPLTILARQSDGTTLTWTSAYASNLGGGDGAPGSVPNEPFTFSSAIGIVALTFDGLAAVDDSLALDDLSIASAIPEPAGALLALAGVALLAWRRRLHACAACAALALAPAAHALGELGALTLSPNSVPPSTATDVTVTAMVVDPKVTAGSLVLQSVDPDNGKILAVLGTLADDGKNGDLKAGDKIFTLRTSVNTARPLTVRVSYGVNGSARRLACRTLPISTNAGPLNPVTPAALQAFLDANKGVRTGAQLLASLPADYRRNWIFMTRTESAQDASPLFPRVLVPGQDAGSIFAFELDDGGGTRSPDNVEYMAFDGARNRFTFQSVDMAKGKVVNHDDPADKTCSSCHAGRPNWDAYDFWGGMLPFNRDRFYKDSLEVKAMLKILKDRRADPLVSRLELPPGFTTTCDGDITVSFDSTDKVPTVPKAVSLKNAGGVITYVRPGTGTDTVTVQQGGTYRLLAHSAAVRADEGRGVTMFDLLSAKNAKRVGQSVIDQDRKVVDLRPVALAIADTGRGCSFTDLTKWAPQPVLDKLFAFNGVATLDALVTDTMTRRTTLPQLKANLEARNLNGANGLIMQGANEAPGIANVTQEIFRRSVKVYRFDAITGAAIDREIYGNTKEDLRIALFRLFLLPARMPVDEWSMSVNSRSTTYTFGDVFGPTIVNLYLPAIKASVLTQAGFAAMDCAKLQDASFLSYKNALATDPTYFDKP